MERGVGLFLDKYEHFVMKHNASGSRSLDCTIHPDDEMYAYHVPRGWGQNKSWMNYFMLGSDLTRTIMQLANWKFAGRTDRIRFLEFACGHGRIVRHLVRCLPAENIFVSDIYPSAVQFVTERFGVSGRVSVHDPKDLDWSERFDLIVVPSLFSHLPESTFSLWIKVLYDLLTDGGILVFSVLGDHLLDPSVVVPGSGIHFLEESESSTLDPKEYGLSYVTEAFVREQICKGTGRALYSMTKRGFWKHQDFYLVAKSDSTDVASFGHDFGLAAHLDKAELDANGALVVSGWARDTNQARNDGVTVVVSLDGQTIGVSGIFSARPDVAKAFGDDFVDSGFEVQVPELPSDHHRSDILAVEVVSPSQRNCIYALPLGEHLPAGTVLPEAGLSCPAFSGQESR